MNICIDESGTFTTDATKRNSWCVVAAYVSPERDRAKIERIIAHLRLKFGAGQEVKISDVPESAYLEFLAQLNDLNGLLFATAADMSMHDRASVDAHQREQAEKIVQHEDKMLYEAGKSALRKLAADILALPLQLYTQLQIQSQLVARVLRWAPVYFVQHHPQTLGSFRWRIDRKDIVLTRYEEAFRNALSAMLQTVSMREPMISLEGADYRRMARFEFPDGKLPNYLKEEYGLEVKSGLDLRKIIHEDFKFVDSAQFSGVQVADLCASGVRRLLRGQFQNESSVAARMGQLMLSPEKGKSVIQLTSLGRTGEVDERLISLFRALEARNRPFV